VPILRVALYPSHDRSALRRALNYASFALSAMLIGIPLAGEADVVYVLNLPTVAFAALVRKIIRKTPYILNIPDIWPESVLESGMVSRGQVKKILAYSLSLLNSLTYKHAAAITVISPGFKRMLVERGVPESKVHVIYNWIDEDLFRPVPRDDRLAKQLGFEGRFNIVYAGNLGALQGLDAVIRAAVRIQGGPPVQVVFVGTGQMESELKTLATQLRANNVLFLGRRDLLEMPAIYALADVLLVHLKDLPFLGSTIPSKTQVSLAVGRPVIMAVRGDAADIVRKAGAGIVCEPEDEAALAQAMLRLATMDKGELEAMGANGRSYYLKEMALAVGAERLVKLFDQINSCKQ